MLDSAEIKNTAQKQTNLDFFGNPLFLEGFESLVYSINKEADLNDVGLEAQKYRLIGVLANFYYELKKLASKHQRYSMKKLNHQL